MGKHAQEAFTAQLYAQYYQPLEKQCRRIVQYNPELDELISDCLQKVFLKAFQAYDKLKDHPNVGGWLFLTTRNALMDELRRYNRQQALSALPIDSCTERALPSLYDYVEQFIENDAVQQCINAVIFSLTPGEKEIFQKHFMEGMGVLEIADENGVTQGAVKGAIHRIRLKAKAVKKQTNFLSILFVSYWIFQSLNI